MSLKQAVVGMRLRARRSLKDEDDGLGEAHLRWIPEQRFDLFFRPVVGVRAVMLAGWRRRRSCFRAQSGRTDRASRGKQHHKECRNGQLDRRDRGSGRTSRRRARQNGCG